MLRSEAGNWVRVLTSRLPVTVINPAVQTLPSLQNIHVLVIGDVMLDRYWQGDAERVSQEAPVPVVDVKQVVDQPGGAANVALNVVSLGARCTLVGAVGADEAGEALRRTLAAAGVECRFVEVPDWPTIVKLRIVSQRQQLLRTDFERPLPASVSGDIERVAAEVAPTASGIILEDYDKGTLDQPAPLIRLGSNAGVPVVVDPKFKPFASYAGASLLKPNVHEFRNGVGGYSDADDLATKAQLLASEHDIGAIAITHGDEGITVVAADGERQHLPAHQVEVFDPTGAGDTTAAALGVCMSVGMTAFSSAAVANLAASLVVAKAGTAAVTGPELNQALARTTRTQRGVMDRVQLGAEVAAARVRGERIVFTNGCFDILHAGHVAYLEEARALGERLVVAVNDDASVARLKGEGRPVNRLDRRMAVLSGLSAVDWVVGFHEDTPEPLLEQLQPDVLVKGGDYGDDEVVGADIVRGYGGGVTVLSLVEDCSTTAIVEQIRQDG